MTKHFFKALIVFMGMITLGLLGIFLVSYFDKTKEVKTTNQAKSCEKGVLC